MSPTSVFDLLFMLIATILTMLSFSTLQMLAKIKMEKSLFIPIMTSAAFFWCGSVITVVYQILVESTPSLLSAQAFFGLVGKGTLLIGLGILTYGVFSYWRITKNVKLAKHKQPKVSSVPKNVKLAKHKQPKVSSVSKKGRK